MYSNQVSVLITLLKLPQITERLGMDYERNFYPAAGRVEVQLAAMGKTPSDVISREGSEVQFGAY